MHILIEDVAEATGQPLNTVCRDIERGHLVLKDLQSVSRYVWLKRKSRDEGWEGWIVIKSLDGMVFRGEAQEKPITKVAKVIAAKANTCCDRSDGWEENLVLFIENELELMDTDNLED